MLRTAAMLCFDVLRTLGFLAVQSKTHCFVDGFAGRG
jgi:hypothetical protein